MTIEKINVNMTIQKVQELLDAEKGLSPALRASIETLLLLIGILLKRLGLNSSNSSKPPSMDKNRKKEQKASTGRKPGGQNGHAGSTLQQFPEPDQVKEIPVDRSNLPQGEYREVGYDARQVVDLDISSFITEWRAQILEDQNGKRYVAPFPEGVTKAVQYGIGVKVNAVYMSQFQLIPYNRVVDHFNDQLHIPISSGSINNFIKEAFERLEYFEQWIKKQLIDALLLHGDETGINICGKIYWLHNLSNALLTYYHADVKRGSEAMDAMGVLPHYSGIICHDHWKPYYRYDTIHSLCNAHHLRELKRAYEQDGQQWAETMSCLLTDINKAVNEAGGRLEEARSLPYRQRYRAVLDEAEKECPPPEQEDRKGKRGRVARSKARNLLERLRGYEDDVLRFMDNEIVPFSNNQAENDLRMTKVQQKISGCFRSLDGARMFCRIRSYISTCRKHGISATEALQLLFQGTWPLFMMPIQNGDAE